MVFLEKNLEDIIWETDNKILRNRGLDIHGKKLRQLRIGNYGIADLITFQKRKYFNTSCDNIIYDRQIISINIFELKKDKVGIGAFLQAVGYVNGIKRYIEQRSIFENHLLDFKITLIGNNVDNSASFIYLPDLMSSSIESYCLNGIYHKPLELNIFTYDYKFDGIYFREHDGYCLTNEGFNIPQHEN